MTRTIINALEKLDSKDATTCTVDVADWLESRMDLERGIHPRQQARQARMDDYTIVDTVEADEPRKEALAFSFRLAIETGVPNEVRRHARGTVVVADDNMAVLFAQRED